VKKCIPQLDRGAALIPNRARDTIATKLDSSISRPPYRLVVSNKRLDLIWLLALPTCAWAAVGSCH
jgi:hypothetical protein